LNKVVKKTLSNELKYNDTIILTYKIEYPEIQYSKAMQGEYTFNLYNRKKAIKLENYCKEELYKQAIEVYKYNLENGYPIMVFDIILSYTITYNFEELISLYYDEYIFTGGAHGNTIRTSQTWDLMKSKMIPLDYFFYDNPYFILEILKNINNQISEQIKNGENQYFDNYCQLVLKNFNPQNYYLYNDYIEIYFQQYDIAPYSSGIPTFKI